MWVCGHHVQQIGHQPCTVCQSILPCTTVVRLREEKLIFPVSPFAPAWGFRPARQVLLLTLNILRLDLGAWLRNPLLPPAFLVGVSQNRLLSLGQCRDHQITQLHAGGALVLWSCGASVHICRPWWACPPAELSAISSSWDRLQSHPKAS